MKKIIALKVTVRVERFELRSAVFFDTTGSGVE
jgi:hypothetical protein